MATKINLDDLYRKHHDRIALPGYHTWTTKQLRSHAEWITRELRTASFDAESRKEFTVRRDAIRKELARR